MSAPEDKPPRKKNGSAVAIFILTLCAAGAAFTALNYTAQAISTDDAQMLFDGKVLATIPTTDAKKILKGMPATITVDGYGERKFTGIVDMLSPDPDSSTDTLLMLDMVDPPGDARPPVACQVTVDTSVPPELVRVHK